MFLYGV